MKKTRFFYYITSLFLLLTIYSSSDAASVKRPTHVGIMTYNVENLFDTKHDDGKEDYTFLPLSFKNTSEEVKKYCGAVKVPKWKEQCFELDWSDDVLTKKLKNLTTVISKVNHGQGPDILILEEVENETVLRKLVDQLPSHSKYQTVILIEGKDQRGIDVAIVSRLAKKGDPELHEIPFQDIPAKDLFDTRGILEVTLELPDGTPITVYANHFPAPFHKTQYRVQAYEYLTSLAAKKPADQLQVAGGDFNTTSEEEHKKHLIEENVEKQWIVSFHKGYKGQKGSSYYPKDKTWAFLDMLLLSNSLDTSKSWRWNPNTFQVINQAKGQTSKEGFPHSFDPKTGEGMSDHLPVYLEIEKQ